MKCFIYGLVAITNKQREFIGEGDLMLKQINSIKALFKLTHIKWMNEFVDILKKRDRYLFVYIECIMWVLLYRIFTN